MEGDHSNGRSALICARTLFTSKSPERKSKIFSQIGSTKQLMPEISRFYGISVYLYPLEHSPAHFDAFYGDSAEAVFDIASLRVVQGALPNRARAMVLDWAAQHQEELVAAWDRLRAGQAPNKIAPLE
jgi:hypothetical protein